MTPLYLYNGQLLSEGGALAVSENCCCSGECCSNYSNCTFTITENFNNGSSNTAIIKNGAFLDDTFLVGSFGVTGCTASYSAADTGSTGENCNFTWNYSKLQTIDCDKCCDDCSRGCSLGDVISEESYIDQTEGCTISFGISGVDISINCEECSCCPSAVCEWVYEPGSGWRLGDPDGVSSQAICQESTAEEAGCSCPEPDYTPNELTIDFTECDTVQNPLP